MRLVSACTEGKRDTVRKLLDAGVDPDGPDDQRGTPLCFAIIGGQVEIVHALLDAGADAELRTHLGATPLGFAKRVNPEIYRMLRERGARKTGAAAEARAAAEEERSYRQQLADFWATPLAERRGPPPWIDHHQYFENLLVRARVAEIRRALLADEHTRLAPADAANEQAPDNTPVRARQYRPTALAVPQPGGLRLTFARLHGHAWTQIRGGHRLGGMRPFSNEWLARRLSVALRTKAVLYGYEDVSHETYYQLYDRGALVDEETDLEALFRREEILDPDVYWEPADGSTGPDGAPLLMPFCPGAPDQSRGFQREDFDEVDSLTLDADAVAQG